MLIMGQPDAVEVESTFFLNTWACVIEATTLERKNYCQPMGVCSIVLHCFCVQSGAV